MQGTEPPAMTCTVCCSEFIRGFGVRCWLCELSRDPASLAPVGQTGALRTDAQLPVTAVQVVMEGGDRRAVGDVRP